MAPPSTLPDWQPALQRPDIWSSLHRLVLRPDAVDPNDTDLPELARGYADSMANSIQAALGHLNTSMSWTFGLLTAATPLILGLPDSLEKNRIRLWALFGLVLLLGTHFFVRSAKSYLNVIRFNILRRRALEFALSYSFVTVEERRELLWAWLSAVRSYEFLWISPLSRKALATKVLIEFGYGYLVIIILLIGAVLLQVRPPSSPASLASLLVPALAAGYEIFVFFARSPYLRSTLADRAAVHDE